MDVEVASSASTGMKTLCCMAINLLYHGESSFLPGEAAVDCLFEPCKLNACMQVMGMPFFDGIHAQLHGTALQSAYDAALDAAAHGGERSAVSVLHATCSSVTEARAHVARTRAMPPPTPPLPSEHVAAAGSGGGAESMLGALRGRRSASSAMLVAEHGGAGGAAQPAPSAARFAPCAAAPTFGSAPSGRFVMPPPAPRYAAATEPGAADCDADSSVHTSTAGPGALQWHGAAQQSAAAAPVAIPGKASAAHAHLRVGSESGHLSLAPMDNDMDAEHCAAAAAALCSSLPNGQPVAVAAAAQGPDEQPSSYLRFGSEGHGTMLSGSFAARQGAPPMSCGPLTRARARGVDPAQMT